MERRWHGGGGRWVFGFSSGDGIFVWLFRKAHIMYVSDLLGTLVDVWEHW